MESAVKDEAEPVQLKDVLYKQSAAGVLAGGRVADAVGRSQGRPGEVGHAA